MQILCTTVESQASINNTVKCWEEFSSTPKCYIYKSNWKFLQDASQLQSISCQTLSTFSFHLFIHPGGSLSIDELRNVYSES